MIRIGILAALAWVVLAVVGARLERGVNRARNDDR